jgi:putative ABC transport system permease protein
MADGLPCKFIKTIGLQIVNARDFSGSFGDNSGAIIMNETTEKILGWPNPVGEKI